MTPACRAGNSAAAETSSRQTGAVEPNRIARAAADIAPVAALFADRTRARIVTALVDGRALPASVIASEAGVAASTASEHLARLVAGGVLVVEASGRHRYYRLAGQPIAAAVEALAAIAPQPPVRSLREATRAHALRRARTCYDHLAGRLGVAITAGLVERGALARTDGHDGTGRGAADRLAAPVRAHPYELGPSAADVFTALGVDLPVLLDRPPAARPLLRFCVDWSEQRHHLAGALGAALLESAEAAGWVARRPSGRAVDLTPAGERALAATLGVQPAA
jgi:DNA-binding transcriptional ArsR family regulator